MTIPKAASPPADPPAAERRPRSRFAWVLLVVVLAYVVLDELAFGLFSAFTGGH